MTSDDDLVNWPDWGKRKAELLDRADYFEFNEYPAAAEWTRQLAEMVSTPTPRKRLKQCWADTMEAWASDFAGRDSERRKKVAVISRIILGSIANGKFDEEIKIVLPILSRLSQNFSNLTPLNVAFAPFRTKADFKMQFYGLCYHYPLFVEGIFDESVRLLFLLASNPSDKPVSLREINKMDLWDLKEEFKKLELSDLLFGGWKNRVRNSIAHARFRYDADQKKMHFEDVDPRGISPDYSESFTLDQFRRLGAQLSDVYTITQDLIFMTRLQQLALTPDVPGAGEYLVMPTIRQGVKDGLLRDPNAFPAL